MSVVTQRAPLHSQCQDIRCGITHAGAVSSVWCRFLDQLRDIWHRPYRLLEAALSPYSTGNILALQFHSFGGLDLP